MPSRGIAQLTGPAAGRLRVEPLDALTAVFDRASGMTHILASPMPELLDALAGWQGSMADFAARLASTFDLSDDSSGGDDDIMDRLSARIDELVALGLVDGA